MWLDSRVEILSWCLLLSFERWRWIGIKPAIVLIPKEGEVWKAAKIQRAALCCIFLSSLSGYNKEALLKYHSKNPYSTIGRIHVLYKSFLWESDSLIKFSSISYTWLLTMFY